MDQQKQLPKISSSCDPNIEHVIFDHKEITHLIDDIYTKFVTITKEGFSGSLIGIHACEKDGTLIDHGLIIVLDSGVWIRQPNLNDRLADHFDLDEKGRIKVIN